MIYIVMGVVMIEEDPEPLIIAPFTNEQRGVDKWGDGAFLASRGNRRHRGIDLKYEPGEGVLAPIDGTVLRIGYPYQGDDTYKLIEMRDEASRLIIRMFYVNPCVGPGHKFSTYETIGCAQDISEKYGEGMTNHVHIEFIINPLYLAELCAVGEETRIAAAAFNNRYNSSSPKDPIGLTVH